MQMSELMMSSPHNFPCILFTKMMKIPYFSYERVKLAFISTLNRCRMIWGHAFTCLSKNMKIFQILYTKYMENGEAMKSSTHSFAYSYRLLRNVLLEITNIQNFIILFFYPIYITLSLFYLRRFTLSIKTSPKLCDIISF